MNEQFRQEILIKHKRETRFQSFFMIAGVALTMFVATTMMDMFKLVESMKVEQAVIKQFVSNRQGMPEKVKQIAESRLNIHAKQDKDSFEELELRIIALEDFHK